MLMFGASNTLSTVFPWFYEIHCLTKSIYDNINKQTADRKSPQRYCKIFHTTIDALITVPCAIITTINM